MWNLLWLWCFFPLPKKGFKHWDEHLDVHPDVHLDVQFIMVILLGLFLTYGLRGWAGVCHFSAVVGPEGLETAVVEWPGSHRPLTPTLLKSILIRLPFLSRDTFAKVYALLLAESSICTTTLYRDTPPICIAIFLQKYSGQGSLGHPQIQEDINGEKLTVKKWWLFGCRFSRFTQSFSRFIRDINGEKKKTSRYWWSFSRLVFHCLPPLDK